MIKVNGVTKSYVSKEKQRVDALRGVSFELSDTGMVFVLGKSGSGKSTLLNLLGGLDSPTEGEITVDGVSMKDFKQVDYDSYRNSYVGFIFQEYNLLDTFNVKENVELALQLSKGENVDERVAFSLEQVELPTDYLTRRVGELSGGEKQRVAIARSIVKDSKLILADEPTGNLDSATGESIWNILKKLSQTRLVVVVSHDRESAEKYADRIIEIADGEIVSDSGAQSETVQSEARFVATQKRLPFAVRFRMALNSLFKRKGRSVIIVIVSILSTFLLAVVQMLLSFSALDAKLSYIEKHDVPYITVKSADHRSFDYITQNSSYVLQGIVKNKQQVLDFGLTFVGEAQELDETSFYIRLDSLRSICKKKDYPTFDYALIDGKKIKLTEFENSEELLLGKQIHFNGTIPGMYEFGGTKFAENDFAVLAGIIDTDSVSKFVVTGGYNYLPTYFSTEDFKYRNFSTASIVSAYANNLILSSNGNNIYGTVGFHNFENLSHRLVTTQGLVTNAQEQGFAVADDEIVVSYDLYTKLFQDAKTMYYYVDSNFTELKFLPEHVGETVEFKFCDGDGNVLLDWGSYKLVGVDFNSHEIDGIFINENAIKQLTLEVRHKRGSVLIKTDTVKSVSNFVRTLINDYHGDLVNSGNLYIDGNPMTADHVVWMFESDINLTSIIFSVLGAVLIVVMILLVVNLISFSITSRKREIGILLALGTPQKDVTNTFVLETLILSVVSMVLTVILLFALIAPVNMLFMPSLSVYIPFLHVDLLTVAIVIVATMCLPLLAAWLPIIKLSKSRPVDVIRES